jgi:hypothetical protein
MAGPCGGDCIDPEVTGCQCGMGDTPSIAWTGSGAEGDLFAADVQIDPDPDNPLEEASGLLVNPAKLHRTLGGFISETLPGTWTTGSATYVDWGGADVTLKEFTKLGGAAETDILVMYALTAYVTGGNNGTSEFATAVRIDGTDYDGSRWPISWPVDEISIGAALATLNDTVSEAQGDNTVVVPGASYSQADEQEFRADAVLKINQLVNLVNDIRSAVIGIGDNPWAHKVGFAAAGGIPSGAFDVELRAKKLAGDNDIGVDTRCDFSYIVYEVPAGVTFH